MSAYALTSDFATFRKTSKSNILITPHNEYINTELDDEKLDKLYSMYCGLLLMQYQEDCAKKNK